MHHISPPVEYLLRMMGYLVSCIQKIKNLAHLGSDPLGLGGEVGLYS